MTEVVARAWRRAVAVLVAGVLGCGTAALDFSEAALASAPFAVSLAVSPAESGNSVTVSIELRSTGAVDAMEPFDLYVMQLQGFQDAVFMTASGSWSPSPASLRQGLSVRGFAPVTVRWTEGRLGSIHLLVIAARASSDPFVQANWLFRPVLRGAAVRRRLADVPDRCAGHLGSGGPRWTQRDGHWRCAVPVATATGVHFLTRPRSPEQYRPCEAPAARCPGAHLRRCVHRLPVHARRSVPQLG